MTPLCPILWLLAGCSSCAEVEWTLPPSPCPPGMVLVEGGTYTTGMKEPLPYAIVDTTTMEDVDSPEERCPEAIAATPGATACWVQTDHADPVVTLREVTVEPYCVERYPFPGAGAPNPPDGLTTWDASLFDEILSSGRFGPRRMCTYTEYQLAVAGPSSNHRFIYGDEPDPGRCATRESDAIGSHPRCKNPETGLFDYGAVIGQWVHLDQQLVDHSCGGPGGCPASGGAPLGEKDEEGSFKIRYIVAGGTHRLQTRQAPWTPHTWHDHGQVSGPDGCDDWGWDDGMAVCADPSPLYAACPEDPAGEGCQELARRELGWSDLVEFCRGERMTRCLSRGLTTVRGRRTDACPGGGGELGPGQGR